MIPTLVLKISMLNFWKFPTLELWPFLHSTSEYSHTRSRSISDFPRLLMTIPTLAHDNSHARSLKIPALNLWQFPGSASGNFYSQSAIPTFDLWEFPCSISEFSRSTSDCLHAQSQYIPANHSMLDVLQFPCPIVDNSHVRCLNSSYIRFPKILTLDLKVLCPDLRISMRRLLNIVNLDFRISKIDLAQSQIFHARSITIPTLVLRKFLRLICDNSHGRFLAILMVDFENSIFDLW